MPELIVEERDPGYFFIKGELTFSSINKKTLKMFAFLNKNEAVDIIFDLNQIESTDSAGLALVVEWLKMARRRQINLHLANMPEQLMALAKVGGLADAIGLRQILTDSANSEHYTL